MDLVSKSKESVRTNPLFQAITNQLQVLRLAPREFVGPTSRLVPLLQLLCTEMGAAFGRAGLTCPPWRQAAAMMSKWLPSKARCFLGAQILP